MILCIIARIEAMIQHLLMFLSTMNAEVHNGFHGGCVLCVVLCKSLSSISKPLASVCKPWQQFAKHSWLDVLVFAYPRSFHVNGNRNINFFANTDSVLKNNTVVCKSTLSWQSFENHWHEFENQCVFQMIGNSNIRWYCRVVLKSLNERAPKNCHIQSPSKNFTQVALYIWFFLRSCNTSHAWRQMTRLSYWHMLSKTFSVCPLDGTYWHAHLIHWMILILQLCICHSRNMQSDDGQFFWWYINIWRALFIAINLTLHEANL